MKKPRPLAVLVSVNARYTHSTPSLYTLEKLLSDYSDTVHHETTISCDPVAEGAVIAAHDPDIVLFSAYIWNGTVVRRIAEALRAAIPQLIIVAGGPEAWHNRWGDMFIAQSLKSLVKAFQKRNFGQLIEGEEYHIDELPFAYSDTQLELMKKRYLYYETSRGCAFSCAYCLSGAGEELSFRSLDRVLPELDRFMNHRVQIVKFIDRTFNIDSERSLAIWRHILAHNRDTTFHFEIHPAIMSDAEIEFCKTVPGGMFRFEAGIQTTNACALSAVNRSPEIARSLEVIARLSRQDNIHIHAGLIAGLPRDTRESFLDAIDATAHTGAHYIQIGTLKLLSGSTLHARAPVEGLCASKYPPYQILKTPQMGLSEITLFSDIEHLFDILYNDCPCPLSLGYIRERCTSLSRLFVQLVGYCRENHISIESRKTEKIAHLLYLTADLAGCRDTFFLDRLALEWAPSLSPWPQWLEGYEQSTNDIRTEVIQVQRSDGRQAARSLIFVPQHEDSALLKGLPRCRAYCFTKAQGPSYVRGDFWFSG